VAGEWRLGESRDWELERKHDKVVDLLKLTGKNLNLQFSEKKCENIKTKTLNFGLFPDFRFI